jgi:hypothetical protein
VRGKSTARNFSSPTISFFFVVVGCCGNLTSSFARRGVGRFDFDFRQDFLFLLFFPPPKTAVNSHFYRIIKLLIIDFHLDHFLITSN